MYFKDRRQAGELLAEQLSHYRFDDCVVIALSDGSILVGEEIASRLHTTISLLLTDTIHLPGDNDEIVGVINQAGGFTYNNMIPASLLEEYEAEFHIYFEEQKIEKMHRLNQLLGENGIVEPDILKDRIVIIVSDGLKNGISFQAAVEYMKPIRVKRIVAAVSVASVTAVDKLHILSDEICCLNVTDNYLGTDHYYEDNVLPSHAELIESLNTIIHKWV